MKKTIMIASAVVAGTAAMLYLIRRKRRERPSMASNGSHKRSHHATTVFVKAKEHINETMR